MRDSERNNSRKRMNIWLGIGAVVLILLLILWLTFADFAGDTDVAAAIPNLLPVC